MWIAVFLRVVFFPKEIKMEHGALWCFDLSLAFFSLSGDASCMNFNPVLSFGLNSLFLIFANLQVHYASGMIEFCLHGVAFKTVAFNFLSVIPWNRCVLGYGMSVGHIHT